jgi:hypothetical protein
VTLSPPNRVVTRVEGYDDRPWPDVDFAISITDTIAVAPPTAVSGCGVGTLRRLMCTSSTVVDVDDADKALAIILGILSLPLPPLSVHLFDALIEASGGSAGSGPPSAGGVGCGLVAFANLTIPLPGRGPMTPGTLIALNYMRSLVTPGGIFAAGTFTICGRTPTLVINGPRLLGAYIDDSEVRASYSASSMGTVGALRSLSWAASGGTVATPASPTTRISFSLPASSSPMVTLSGADADGPLPPVTARVQIKLMCRRCHRVPVDRQVNPAGRRTYRKWAIQAEVTCSPSVA